MKFNLFLLITLILLSCGPDPIPEPEPSSLIAPVNLNECTTAIVLNDLERQVQFEWTMALNTDSYQLVIENSLTNIKYGKTTSLLKESVILPSGAPYSWHVNSTSLLSPEVGKSQVWQFYLEGSAEETFFPFPAVLETPENKSTVTLSDSGSIIFLWKGHDLDQDIDRFDFYIGKTEDNLVKEQEGLKDEQISLTLDNGVTYFWQVVTFDRQNNASKSQIFSFKTAD